MKTLFLIMILFFYGCANNNVSNKVFKNWKQLKEQNIEMQEFDYSCGTGALATLLKYYFNNSVSEKELLLDILNHIPKELIESRKKDGLSLLDLKQVSERRGYQAFGVKLKNSSLLKLDRPILVYIETKDYKHFAVYKGFREDRIFLADPSRGNIRIPTDRFFKEWKGKLALILNKPGYKIKKNLLKVDFDIPLRPELEVIKRKIF